ncbi:MAG: amino acid racemase [Edaphobacter sp.]|uniref:aspartate/glutamate racemase family protein n=1 Tax=Edaphobacter sp. TaxID=1934404 RepID=UPI00239E8349|nr:amino acid racemase [Edaphobacter sp.]MDE1175930.1 amino acid racemase [Edaphobacter sp.]
MTRHIGIVACSAEGAALCYRTICSEAAALLGPHAHPEISLHSHSLADYMDPIQRGDWDTVGDIMLSSANKLHAAGADFLICPDNTIHQAMLHVTPSSPLPWLHIAKVVADEAARRGYRRIALTGTKWLVESGVYPEQLTERHIEYSRPNAQERAEINRIIMDELVYGADPQGAFRPESIAYLQQVITRLRDECTCDAVLLGCTEIPLILNDTNSPLPTLDSTRLLARAALKQAVS